MKVNKGTIILSILATICFIIVYFRIKDTLNLVLGCAWSVITIEEFVRLKRKSNK